MREMSYYEGEDLPLVIKANFSRVHVMKSGKVVWSSSEADYKAALARGDISRTSGVTEREFDKEAYDEALKTRRGLRLAREEELKSDLALENNLTSEEVNTSWERSSNYVISMRERAEFVESIADLLAPYKTQREQQGRP